MLKSLEGPPVIDSFQPSPPSRLILSGRKIHLSYSMVVSFFFYSCSSFVYIVPLSSYRGLLLLFSKDEFSRISSSVLSSHESLESTFKTPLQLLKLKLKPPFHLENSFNYIVYYFQISWYHLCLFLFLVPSAFL